MAMTKHEKNRRQMIELLGGVLTHVTAALDVVREAEAAGRLLIAPHEVNALGRILEEVNAIRNGI